MPTVHLLDYVAGNIRSLVNAIEKVGYTVEWIKTPEDVAKAEVIRFSRCYVCAKLMFVQETHSPRRGPFRALPVATKTGWLF